MDRIQVRLHPDILMALQREALRTGSSVSAVVRDLLRHTGPLPSLPDLPRKPGHLLNLTVPADTVKAVRRRYPRVPLGEIVTRLAADKWPDITRRGREAWIVERLGRARLDAYAHSLTTVAYLANRPSLIDNDEMFAAWRKAIADLDVDHPEHSTEGYAFRAWLLAAHGVDAPDLSVTMTLVLTNPEIDDHFAIWAVSLLRNELAPSEDFPLYHLVPVLRVIHESRNALATELERGALSTHPDLLGDLDYAIAVLHRATAAWPVTDIDRDDPLTAAGATSQEVFVARCGRALSRAASHPASSLIARVSRDLGALEAGFAEAKTDLIDSEREAWEMVLRMSGYPHLDTDQTTQIVRWCLTDPDMLHALAERVRTLGPESAAQMIMGSPRLDALRQTLGLPSDRAPAAGTG